MNSLFFFTTSLNFGNIFSSESISPEIYYSKRGFGFDYYENPFPEITYHIVLFDRFPNVEIQPETPNIDIFKIVFELDPLAIRVDKSEMNGVWLCPDTIYLSLQNVKKIYFYSNEEKVKVVAKAASSKTLKMLPKYEQFFETSLPTSMTSYRSLTINDSLNHGKSNLGIERDRVFNNFKGLIYGIICGKLNQRDPEEIKFNKSLKDIQNSFALLKNSTHHITSGHSKKFNDSLKSSNGKHSTINDITKTIQCYLNESERLFINSIGTIGVVNYVSEYLKSVVLKNIKEINHDHIEGALGLLNFIPDIEKHIAIDARKWFWEKNPNNPYILYEVIRHSVAGYLETSNKEKLDNLDSDISKAIFGIEKQTERKLFEKNKYASAAEFQFIKLNDLEISLPKELNKDSKFEQLINAVFQNAKKNKGKITDQQLIPVVESAGEIFREGQGKNSNLYRYLTKQENVYREKKKHH